MEEVIRFNALRQIVSLSRSTIWRMERAGTFPARRQLSGMSVGWLKSEVEKWVQSRALAGGGDHA